MLFATFATASYTLFSTRHNMAGFEHTGKTRLPKIQTESPRQIIRNKPLESNTVAQASRSQDHIQTQDVTLGMLSLSIPKHQTAPHIHIQQVAGMS